MFSQLRVSIVATALAWNHGSQMVKAVI